MRQSGNHKGKLIIVRMPRLPLAKYVFVLLAAALLPIGLASTVSAQSVPLPRERPQPQSDILKDVQAAPELPQPATPEDDVVYQASCPALLSGRVIGRALPPISDNGCGLQSPLEISGLYLSGRQVGFSLPVTINCRMAEVLVDWAEDIDAYATALYGARLDQVLTGTSYMCRRRNNAATGKISEHGFGNAVDVTGFVLSDGQAVSLPADWPVDGGPAPLLDFARDAACGHFTTVLSPDANALHEDHLHVDLGCHGQRCLARICE